MARPRSSATTKPCGGPISDTDHGSLSAPVPLRPRQRRYLRQHRARAGDDLSGYPPHQFRAGRTGHVLGLCSPCAGAGGIPLLGRVCAGTCVRVRHRRCDRAHHHPPVRAGAGAVGCRRLSGPSVHHQQPRRLAVHLQRASFSKSVSTRPRQSVPVSARNRHDRRHARNLATDLSVLSVHTARPRHAGGCSEPGRQSSGGNPGRLDAGTWLGTRRRDRGDRRHHGGARRLYRTQHDGRRFTLRLCGRAARRHQQSVGRCGRRVHRRGARESCRRIRGRDRTQAVGRPCHHHRCPGDAPGRLVRLYHHDPGLIMAIAQGDVSQTIPKASKEARIRALRIAGIVALLAIACSLPFVVSSYRLLQFTMVVIYSIALLGLNILTGYNGQISLGHGAFYAIGAYTTAILLERTGIPYWATIPIAGVICLLVGFLFGLPALRLEGHYLALSTFALAVATPQLLKFRLLESWTGGVQGTYVPGFKAPFGLPLAWDQWLYLLSLAFAIVLFVLARNLLRGNTGTAIIAIRDHPIAAASMVINISLYKSVTFGISAMYTGIAGAFGALVAQFVSPDSFSIFLSLGFLVGSVIGGVASISGAVFGAFFIQFIPNFADQISKAATWAVYGAFLIGFMYLMPTGVAGFLARIWRRARSVRGLT